MVRKNLSKLALLFAILVMASCSEDDSMNNPEMGGDGNTTSVYLTDAPIDQANVQAVFITVADVMVNGQSIDGFSKTTVEISSLTNGQKELLGELDLDAGMTSDITLVLSETNAAGDGPGNFIVLDGDVKQDIGGSMELNLSDDAEIMEGMNDLVLDFDLRKSISQNGDEYSFVSESALESNIHAINSANAGMVSGMVDNSAEASGELIVAYIYPKGQFSEAEESANAEGVAFANATSSAMVDSSGEFTIHYLDEGDYELHFASFDEDETDGSLQYNGMVSAETAGAIDLSGFTVDSETETEINISFTGLLGL